MAKRELSSVLKNLKFMQRAIQKEEKVQKEEHAASMEASPSCSAARRCVVIMEGDPHPAVTTGRMSFLSFNPSIDKLNQETSDVSGNNSAAPSSSKQGEAKPTREIASPQQHKPDNMEMDSSNGDLKRKQADVTTMEEQFPNKAVKNNQCSSGSSPSSGSRRSQKQQKRDKLDWSILRPPKPQSKKR